MPTAPQATPGPTAPPVTRWATTLMLNPDFPLALQRLAPRRRHAEAPAAPGEAGWRARSIDLAHSTRTLGDLREEKRQREAADYVVVIESDPFDPDALVWWERRVALVLPDLDALRECDGYDDESAAPTEGL